MTAACFRFRWCPGWLLLTFGCCALMLPTCCSGQDQTQRPLPLPDRAAGVPAASRLLQKLRQTIEQHERAPVPPAALDQLGSMLKKLQEQLPRDVVPPGLGGLSPDALQKSLQQPETQQKMKEMLQQFKSDGLLPPPSAEGNTAQGPVPPLPAPKLTPESTESLRDFLEQLQQQAESVQEPRDADQETPGTPAEEKLPGSESVVPPGPAPGSPAAPPRTLRRRDNSGSNGSAPRSRLQPPRPLPPAEPDPSGESVPEPRAPRLRQPIPLPEQPGEGPEPGVRPEPGRPADPGVQTQPGLKSEPGSESDLSAPARSGVPPEPGARPDSGMPANPGVQTQPDLKSERGSKSELSTPSQPGVPSQRGAQSEPRKSPEPDVQSRPQVQVQPGAQPKPGVLPQPDDGRQPRQRAGQGQGGRSANADRDSLGTIGDLLQQQSRRMAPADSSVPPENVPAGPDAELKDLGERSSGGEQSEQQKQREQQERRERVAGQLQEQGFGRTLRNLLDEARQEAESAEQQRGQEQPERQSDGAFADKSPMESASPQQLINDLMQQIQEEQRKRVQRGVGAEGSADSPLTLPRPEQRLRPPPPARPENSPARGGKGFADRALELFQDLVRDLDRGPAGRQAVPMEPGSTRPLAAAASPSKDESVADSSAAVSALEGINWGPLLTAGGVLLVLLLLLPAARILQRRVLSGDGLLSATPLAIHLVRTREDLVRAFDRWALSCSTAVKPWWNHRQVERELVRRADSAKVSKLVQVYEQARYQPVEEPLSDVQLATARMLLQECSGGAGVSR